MRTLFPRAVPGVLDALPAAMARFGIVSPARKAAFLAQVGHESAGLSRLVENLRYTAQGLAQTWPTRYRGAAGPNERAVALARAGAEAIASATYANRNGNGPEASGDGWRYRGRGLVQVTGRANYRLVGRGLGLPLEEQPELLEQPINAVLSAAWWWQRHGLNELADAGRFEAITRRINGGLNGHADRVALRDRIAAALRGLPT